ncbi:hypothetical protein CICLE_v10003110mg [Citrus x clementina]|uniref:C3H1-type domain-containing protein n=1 Tax=Citrus clementina TaxID=85681 RepID=V4SVX7_CITCL|nr:hypothetical protein CICLE_v10003110mg [Citrus x clementina]
MHKLLLENIVLWGNNNLVFRLKLVNFQETTNLDIEDPEDQVDSDTEEEVENVDKNNKQVDEITGNQMTRRKFCYPQRPGVHDCSYYLRTGRCRFGMSCKFNHPVPRQIQVSFGFCDTLFSA